MNVKIFGLRTKIIVLLIVLITAVMAVTTYMSVRAQVDGRIEEFTQQARAVGQVFGLNYARSLLTEQPVDDRQSLSTQLWKETTDRAVYLVAYGVRGNTIHQTPETLPEQYQSISDIHPEQIRRLLRSDRSYLRRWDREQELYDVLVPIRYHGSRFGVIRLGLNTQEIGQARSTIIYQNVRFTALFWVVAALIGMLATGRIVRPVESLVSVTRTLGEGDLSVRSDVNTYDEIGELSDRFNEMAEQIQQRMRERERSLEQLQAIQTVGTTLNENTDPEVFFPVMDEALQALYDIEEFVAVIRDGDVYSSPYSRPELDSPLFLAPDNDVIEEVNREAEPFPIDPGDDWPPALQSANWAYPLKVAGTLNGVLFMKLGHEPDEQELNWMTIWGTQVAQAIRAMVTNQQIEGYRSQPLRAIRDRIETLISNDFSDFGRLDLPEFVERQQEEGLFYGEHFSDDIQTALGSLSMELEVVQIRPDRYLIAGGDLNSFDRSDVEEAIEETGEFTFTVEWLEDQPTVELVEQLLIR